MEEMRRKGREKERTWTAAHQASPSITNSRSLYRPTFIELVMPSNHLILCHPLLLLLSIIPGTSTGRPAPSCVCPRLLHSPLQLNWT